MSSTTVEDRDKKALHREERFLAFARVLLDFMREFEEENGRPLTQDELNTLLVNVSPKITTAFIQRGCLGLGEDGGMPVTSAGHEFLDGIKPHIN